MAEDSISILAYGGAGTGKTTLGLTGPSPTLLLDSETGSRFIDKKRKVMWNPAKGEAIPDISGIKDAVVVVRIAEWGNVEAVMKHLRSHKHPFRTLVFDSISEVQNKAKKHINSGQFKIQDWGELGRAMGDLLRELRDIAADPDSPIMVLYQISIAEHSPATDESPETWGPLLEGSVRKIAPYLFDITALISMDMVPSNPNDPFSPKVKSQSFYTDSSNPNISAKSRVPGLPGNIRDLTLTGLYRNIFGEEPEPTPEVTPEPTATAAKAPEPPKDKKPSGGAPRLPTS